jgi:hypothetical protein
MGNGTRISLRGRIFVIWAILVWITLIPDDLRSQVPVPGNIRINWLPDTLHPIEKKIRFRIFQELEYSLSTSLLLFLNWKEDPESNHLDLMQNLKYKLLLGNERSFRFSNKLDHNLGFQYYFDSISGINTDDNTLTTRLEWDFHGKIGVIFNSTLATRILKGFDYHTDSNGAVIKVMNSSFLTPLIWTFSLGLGFTFKKAGTLTLEVSSAKLTYIRDRSVFKVRETHQFYGVPEDKNHIFEYGLGLQLLIDTWLFKKVHWESDIRIFKNWLSPVDLTVNNEFGMRVLKFLKIGMRTRIIYENEISKKIQIENLVSFGFFFKL